MRDLHNWVTRCVRSEFSAYAQAVDLIKPRCLVTAKRDAIFGSSLTQFCRGCLHGRHVFPLLPNNNTWLRNYHVVTDSCELNG